MIMYEIMKYANKDVDNIIFFDIVMSDDVKRVENCGSGEGDSLYPYLDMYIVHFMNGDTITIYYSYEDYNDEDEL